jgi:hypothetical protein
MTIGEIIRGIVGVILIFGFMFVLLCNAKWSIDEYKKKTEEQKNKELNK